MTKEQAIKILNSKYPNLKVVAAYRLISNGKSYVLLEAPDVPEGKTDVNDPFYAVGLDKKVYSYSPADDLDNFHRALRNEL